MADSVPATADKLPKDLAAEKGMVNVQIDDTWVQVPVGTRMIEACKAAEKEVRAWGVAKVGEKEEEDAGNNDGEAAAELWAGAVAAKRFAVVGAACELNLIAY